MKNVKKETMKKDFLTEFKEFIHLIDEDFLILISNKGIYKRALNDFNKNNPVTIDVKEPVICRMYDSNICKLTADHKKNSCSCPSLKICKHIIHSLLYIKNNYEIVFGETEQNKEFNAQLIYSITQAELVKKLGPKKFNDILFRFNYDIQVEFTEKGFLEVVFTEENTKVQIDTNEPIKRSICSCKSDAFCTHKAEAIMRYQIKSNQKTKDDFKMVIDKVIDEETIQKVKTLLNEIVLSGLARIPQNIIYKLEQKAIFCHNQNMSALEKMLRVIGNELQLFFDKKASFSNFRLQNNITKSFIYCSQLLGSNNKYKVIQMGHRSSYVNVPPLCLVGMGSSGWQSGSGYMGVTTYFVQNKIWYTFTQSRPTFYDGKNNSLEELYEDSVWNTEVSMSEFAISQVRLLGASINRNKRISSSEKTKVYTIKKTDFAFIESLNFAYDNWLKLLEDFKEHFLSIDTPENENLVILKINKWGKSEFNTKSQLFKQPLLDINEKEIEIVLKYNALNKKVMEKLENIEKIGNLPPYLLGKIMIGNEKMIIIPLIIYQDQEKTIESLTMD